MHVARKRCVCGCNLKKGRGRPEGTTRLKGYGVGTSGGRPVGTTAEKGYGVNTSGGRPVGTTAKKGCGTGGGRLPDKWDTSKDKINLIGTHCPMCYATETF